MFSTLSSLLVLKEARRPDLDYDEKFVNKKDKITGQAIKDDAGKAVKVLDKVVANLAGRESATLTRAFKRYKRLLDVLKRMEEAHVKVNAEMKEELEGYFDAKDNVLTRVVETVSMTATLSKYVAAADKPKKTELDYEKVIEQLSALVSEELQPKIVEIIAANTRVTEPTDSAVKLSIKPKDDGTVTEGVMDTLRGWVKSITKKWNDWCSSYDKKLAKIKSDATKVGVVLESAESVTEGRGGGKQKAAAKRNAYMKSRAEIDKHFADHDWPQSLYYTPQEIMRVGHDVHIAPGGGKVGKIKSIDGRKITIAFKDGDETVDVTKVYPSFLSKP